MSNNIHIRTMKYEDISNLVSWIIETPLWQRYGLTKESAEANFTKALAANDQLIIAEYEAKVCGFAWLQSKGFLGRSNYLKLIGVKQGYKGFGIGRKLISFIEQDKEDLFLLVSSFNGNAQAFYKNQGYKEIGAIPNYILNDVDELIFYKKMAD